LDVPDISLTPDVIAAAGATDQAAKQFVTSANTNLRARIPLEAFLLGIKLTYVDDGLHPRDRWRTPRTKAQTDTVYLSAIAVTL
jgi:hypothetical protein